ncbi:MAG: bifunctional [glutamate--ammonia ligase]-adenylyl-L-tyrosine phosphorylase/[glutamate--ammonia-ligase] adenylyltransferase [Betaproteobacteria bacterium]|nr:MAG: bifunctional [glutamate--ammonia ligase]-adenylyl-L-tyrosine phosphorylase/[glutamate--ammonia-ligase] adenylyltransferase [Betaproteobacteria bacterium]
MTQTDTIDHAFHYSRYAARLRRADAAWVDKIVAERATPIDWDDWHTQAMSATSDTIDSVLRSLRKTLMLRTIVSDIVDAAPFSGLVHALTQFADLSVNAAVAAHSKAMFDTATPPRDFSVVAMGKMGGFELNVSSDIDIVFLCEDPDATHTDELAKLARAVSRTLDRSIDGDFVFRVDTRLRPYGDAGPVVPTLDFLERYFVEQGRMWERIAWLRSRLCAGSLQTELSALVQPFVFRRYLDFDAVAGMRDLHAQLRNEKNNPRNIKLGRGGIRELEFGVQLRQLVRGGRDARMRTRTTLDSLAALSHAGLVPAERAHALSSHYQFLRRVEHMLQYRDDLQTQTLPDAADALSDLAAVLGFSSSDAFESQLEAVRTDVAAFFDSTLNGAPALAAAAPTAHATPVATSQTPPPGSAFTDEAQVKQFVEATLNGAKARALPAASRQRLQTLADRALDYAKHSSAPDAAATRSVDLLAQVASRSSYLALMIERPNVLRRVVDLAAASPWAVHYISTHPLLLDELIDSRSLTAAVDYAAWQRELRSALDETGDDTERGMDAVRHFQQGEMFRLLLKDVAGLLTVETLSDHLSALADAVVEQTLQRLLRAANLPDAARIAVIAYGRWGGKELGYASDLDLIFLMPDDVSEHRDALTRIAQRLQSWLTTLTAAGRAYEVDARLRPDGQAGLLLTTVSAFEQYQREKAWTWEHQALTRARFAAGDATVGAQFESIRNAILATPRDWSPLRTDVLDMRERLAKERINKNADTAFDLKHDRGGLVDMEFAVQTLVLRHSATHQTLRANHGNIALAIRAGELGLLGADGATIATSAANAYRKLRAKQHAVRLQAPHGELRAQIPIAESTPMAAPIRAFWERVFQGAENGK